MMTPLFIARWFVASIPSSFMAVSDSDVRSSWGFACFIRFFFRFLYRLVCRFLGRFFWYFGIFFSLFPSVLSSRLFHFLALS